MKRWVQLSLLSVRLRITSTRSRLQDIFKATGIDAMAGMTSTTHRSQNVFFICPLLSELAQSENFLGPLRKRCSTLFGSDDFNIRTMTRGPESIAFLKSVLQTNYDERGNSDKDRYDVEDEGREFRFLSLRWLVGRPVKALSCVREWGQNRHANVVECN
jgi:hypothetical protein